MKAYYDRRAPGYDDWYQRRGRWTGVEPDGWREELDALGGMLGVLRPARTLDVACGTGFMTRRLRSDVTAPDQSARMLDIARGRLPAATLVQYVTPRRLRDELGGGEVLFASRWFVADRS